MGFLCTLFNTDSSAPLRFYCVGGCWDRTPDRCDFDIGSHSVADPGCLSRIPDPDFYPSRIQKQQKRKKISQNLILFNFLNFPRIIELFTQKIVTMLSIIWVWDPGSGKNLFRVPDPGVKKAPDPGSGSATLGSQTLQPLG